MAGLQTPHTLLDHVQVALDLVSLDAATAVLSSLGDTARRVELGTPLVLAAGLEALSTLRSAAPSAEIVADVKICDAGAKIASTAFATGADLVTAVAAAVDDTTWLGTLHAGAAHSATGRRAGIVLDTIGPRIDAERLAELAALAAAEAPTVELELCIHRPKTGSPSFDALFADIAGVAAAFTTIGVAGRLAPAEVEPALAAGFDTIVVGSAITEADDPAAALAAFARRASNPGRSRRPEPVR